MVKISREKQNIREFTFIITISFLLLSLFINFGSVFAAPEGPDSISSIKNETKATVSSKEFNISGGNIATFNLNTTVQNPRWKGFVGNVSGSFTLQDADGATLYDWSLSTISGEVYSTRNSSTISWSTINCSNGSTLNQENSDLSHTNPDDNITRTFNATNLTHIAGFGTHSAFTVGAVSISANLCPTINTYVSNASQDTDFEEVALYDDASIVYAVILEQDSTGFDSNTYDFQMIVPEIGTEGFSGATAYYFYVELT